MATQHHDVIILGAGAAGLMCAATAGYAGRNVLVLDHAKQAGKKILISGGGRCNFTNHNVQPLHFICNNPHFVKSALARYPSQQFIELLDRHGVDYETREHGQLFCLHSAKDIVQVLLTECEWAGAQIQLRTDITGVEQTFNDAGEPNGFTVFTNQGHNQCNDLVVATGGLSMPKLGATGLGYNIAKQFGLNVHDTTASLVPYTWREADKQRYETLSGISLPVNITANDGTEFPRDLLFTHRGLSGPAVLQITNYWQLGESVRIDLLPRQQFSKIFASAMQQSPKQTLKTLLGYHLPKRLVDTFAPFQEFLTTPINQLTHKHIDNLHNAIHHWEFTPNGTEGYRTAEVTKGGVDCNQVSSKNFQATKVPHLYFIGEVLDVTGWLGGFNFQFAWASGVACGLGLGE